MTQFRVRVYVLDKPGENSARTSSFSANDAPISKVLYCTVLYYDLVQYTTVQYHYATPDPSPIDMASFFIVAPSFSRPSPFIS